MSSIQCNYEMKDVRDWCIWLLFCNLWSNIMPWCSDGITGTGEVSYIVDLFPYRETIVMAIELIPRLRLSCDWLYIEILLSFIEKYKIKYHSELISTHTKLQTVDLYVDYVCWKWTKRLVIMAGMPLIDIYVYNMYISKTIVRFKKKWPYRPELIWHCKKK